MEYIKGKITKLLVDHFENNYRRISHALEVLKYAEMILKTGNKNCDYDTLNTVSLLHDVGIRPSEKDLGYNNGKTQERYGPPLSESLLQGIGFPSDKTKKVCDIIGNHHSPSRFDYTELEILKEADKIGYKQIE